MGDDRHGGAGWGHHAGPERRPGPGHDAAEALVAPEVRAAIAQADLVVLNLECCISERGRPWQAPGKPFFFRAPPRAVELLVLLGTDCVTLANNHALDYGVDALTDTLEYLAAAGIAAVGAGADLEQARRPVTLAAGGLRVAVLGVTDHPPDFAAGPDHPGSPSPTSPARYPTGCCRPYGRPTPRSCW